MSTHDEDPEFFLRFIALVCIGCFIVFLLVMFVLIVHYYPEASIDFNNKV